VSADDQTQPIKVEIKGFKTGHFLNRKQLRGTAREQSQWACRMPQSESAGNNPLLNGIAAFVPATYRPAELGINRETVIRYLRFAKPAIFDTPALKILAEAKPAIRAPAKVFVERANVSRWPN